MKKEGLAIDHADKTMSDFNSSVYVSAKNSFISGYDARQIEIAKLTDQLKRVNAILLKIQELGCLYKGNLTGCAGCIICNEFPEFKEMNNRERGGYENN